MQHVKKLRSFIKRDRITRCFLVIQTLNYGVFLSLDIIEKGVIVSHLVKFLIILICFFYVNIKPSKHMIWRVALFFTVLSDFLLLLKDDYYLVGVSSFIIVQYLYGLYLSSLLYSTKSYRKKMFIRLIIICVVTTIISYILFLKSIYIDLLLISSIFYFLIISNNFLIAIKALRKNLHKTDVFLFTIGIFLFLLCDINVGIYNMSYYVDLPHLASNYIKSISHILIWFFYAPSQVLISISSTYS